MKRIHIILSFLFLVFIYIENFAQVTPDYMFGDDHGSGWNWTTGTIAEVGPGQSFKWQFLANSSGNHYFKFGESSSNANGSGFWMNSSPGDLHYTGAGAVWNSYYYSNMAANGAIYFGVTSNKYYVIKSKKNTENTNTIFSVTELSSSPCSILYATDNYRSNGQQVDVAIKISGVKATEENIYVRYTTDGWVTSGFALANGSGENYYATIPGNSITGTANNKYYILTTTTNSPVHENIDLLTLNYNNNFGSNYSIFSKNITMDVRNMESTGQGPFMFTYNSSGIYCGWVECVNPGGFKSVVAYTTTKWSNADTTTNRAAYPCLDCSGATGTGAKTTTSLYSHQTNLLNSTVGVTLNFSEANLTGFQRNCPIGDTRIYSGTGGSIQVSGVTKLQFTDFRFVLNVSYTGSGITGDAYAKLDTAASDPRWLAEFDPFNSGQVQIDFSSFSPIIQLCYASYNAMFTFKPSTVTYHQSSAIVPHEGSATDDIVPLPISKVSHHFTAAVYGYNQSKIVYANEILSTPDGTLPAAVESISNVFWQLSSTLASYTTAITFDLSDVTGLGDVGAYRILRRDNSASEWNVYTDFTLVDPTHIRANNVHALGEWAIGTTKRTLQLTALIQNFYESELNKQVRDTVKVLLRSTEGPNYSIVDSAFVFLDSTGSGTAIFTNTSSNVPYYIVLKHRNALETWSDSSKLGSTKFSSGTMSFNFTDDSSKAFGVNMIKIGSKWCLYGGDVNQDGFVDFTDLALIDNDAYNFSSGYLATDLNGDEFIDFTDLAICDNNAYNFIGVITPVSASRNYKPDTQSVPQRISGIQFIDK